MTILLFIGFLILIILQIAPSLIQNIMKQYAHYIEPRTKVAVLPIRGVLYDSSQPCKQLNTFFKDDEIKAILIKMECPGSTAGTGQAIYNEILSLKKEYPKPVLVLVENVVMIEENPLSQALCILRKSKASPNLTCRYAMYVNSPEGIIISHSISGLIDLNIDMTLRFNPLILKMV